MKKLEALRQICATRSPDMPIDNVVWRGHVLHTHAIALPDGVALDDVGPAAGDRIVLAALTRNSVAELLASLWPGDAKRGRAAYWWGRPLSGRRRTFSDVAEADRARADAARLEPSRAIR